MDGSFLPTTLCSRELKPDDGLNERKTDGQPQPNVSVEARLAMARCLAKTVLVRTVCECAQCSQ